MKNIIVIGALGVVGSKLITDLTRNGTDNYNIIAIDQKYKDVEIFEDRINIGVSVDNLSVVEKSLVSLLDNESDNYVFIALPTNVSEDEITTLDCDNVFKSIFFFNSLSENGDIQGQFKIINLSTISVDTVNDIINGDYENEKMTISYFPERVNPCIYTRYNTEKEKRTLYTADVDVARLLGKFYEITRANSAKEAVISKLFENAQRDVNIQFQNTMKELCKHQGISYDEIFRLASTKKEFVKDFTAGLPGGQCITVDLLGLVTKEKESESNLIKHYGVNNYFCDLAGYEQYTRKIVSNELRRKVKHIIQKKTPDLLNIVFLGLTYKKDAEGLENSAHLTIAKELINHLDNKMKQYTIDCPQHKIEVKYSWYDSCITYGEQDSKVYNILNYNNGNFRNNLKRLRHFDEIKTTCEERKTKKIFTVFIVGAQHSKDTIEFIEDAKNYANSKIIVLKDLI